MMKQSIAMLGGLALALTSAYAGSATTDYTKNMQTPAVEEVVGMGFYAAVFGGANVYQNADFDRTRVHAFDRSFGIDADLDPTTGWFAGVKLGYVFNTHSWFLPAVELEGFYNHLDIEAHATSDELRTEAHARVEMRSAVMMANLLGKIDLGRFRPYFGGGAGAAYVNAGEVDARLDFRGHEVIRIQGDADEFGRLGHFRTDGWTFAWQAIGGFDYYVTPKVSIFAEYKALWYYANTDGVSNYLQHLVGGGVRFHF